MEHYQLIHRANEDIEHTVKEGINTINTYILTKRSVWPLNDKDCPSQETKNSLDNSAMFYYL